MKAAGFKGALYSPGVTYSPSVLSAQPNVAAALDGEYDNVQFAVQELSDSAAVKQINTDLAAIGKPPDVTLGAVIGYWSADQFIAMLQATAAKGPVTPDTLQQTVNAGFTWTPQPAGSALARRRGQQRTRAARSAASCCRSKAASSPSRTPSTATRTSEAPAPSPTSSGWVAGPVAHPSEGPGIPPAGPFGLTAGEAGSPSATKAAPVPVVDTPGRGGSGLRPDTARISCSAKRQVPSTFLNLSWYWPMNTGCSGKSVTAWKTVT